ncbi:hypothetical protein SNEBB_010277 [Seison nebaliae]|nr:hypothetical protein SNEBB_010277 [Seison nebaliae]
MTQPTRYAIEENNPCLKEHEQSLECMDKHSKRFCKEIIENYKNCKKFWGAVQKLHLDNGRSRRLPENNWIFLYHQSIKMVHRGLESMYELYRSQLRTKEDALLIILHWAIDQKQFSILKADGTLSELLPNNWNYNDGIYEWNYMKDGNKITMKSILNQDDLLINLQFDKFVEIRPINSSDFVTDDYKESFSKAFKNLDEAVRIIQKETVEKLFNRKEKEVKEKQNKQNERQNRNIINPFDINPTGPSLFPGQIGPMGSNPIPSYGGNDLFPNFGRVIPGNPVNPIPGFGGGGMMFDPSSLINNRPPNTGLPNGAVPPGARFDPIYGQPGRPGNPRAEPNPDHLPPPNGYDDMFM